MTRTTIDELKNRRLDAMSPEERAAFDRTYDATRLALEVGEKVRDARDGATLTTLQKVAAALDLKITFDLSAAS